MFGGSDGVIEKASRAVNDIKIPSVRNNEFNKWFDNMSVEEFQKLWDDPKAQEIIKARIRKPGKLHEWLVASRADVFKKWGVSMDDIKEFRTLIEDVIFVNPPGVHGGIGSTTAHNEIIALIDHSSGFEKFVKSLNNWATDRLPNGILDLPEGLRR
ncbi:hypothetical protein HCJ66_15885 [Listeria sp. FSL L7-1582]|nr:hypothetical protein [Listeria portnoyi]